MTRIMNSYRRADVAFVKGEGSFLFDESGEKYLDFTSGISVCNLGHCHPRVSEALARQAGELMHTSNLFRNPLQEELARRISYASFGGLCFFGNSGAEANEGALKLARIYGNKKYEGLRYKVITMENSFHGRTFATLSATGQEKIHDGFTPIADYFIHVPMNDFYAVEQHARKHDVAAVMIELVQGEGGLTPVDRGYLRQLRDYCTANDILLIFDEIQTGFGRTGKMFGYQQFGIEPDVMTLAKALGNGFPIGAVVAKPEFAEYFAPGTHGSTFGGNYLGCAAALEVMNVMQEESFLPEVERKGRLMRELMKKEFEPAGCTVVGMGMMVGVRFPFEPSDFIAEARKQKLLLVGAGKNTVRFYPPLTASDAEIEEGIAKAAKALKATLKKQS